jgi:hypothetical protein
MAAQSALPPAPRGDAILRICNATVTRSVIERKARYRLGSAGSLLRESLRFPDKHLPRIDLAALDDVLERLGCPAAPGFFRCVLAMLGR